MKKNLKKVTKYDTPSVFLVSSFLLLIWKETFISQDLELVLPSDKERKPQHTGQLHTQARKERSMHFNAILEDWITFMKDSSSSHQFPKIQPDDTLKNHDEKIQLRIC